MDRQKIEQVLIDILSIGIKQRSAAQADQVYSIVSQLPYMQYLSAYLTPEHMKLLAASFKVTRYRKDQVIYKEGNHLFRSLNAGETSQQSPRVHMYASIFWWERHAQGLERTVTGTHSDWHAQGLAPTVTGTHSDWHYLNCVTRGPERPVLHSGAREAEHL